MWSAEHLLLIAAVFVLAGFVKGIIGLGLPTISLALMAALLGLKDAIALMLIPAIATNVWQGLAGPHLKSILRRGRELAAVLKVLEKKALKLV